MSSWLLHDGESVGLGLLLLELERNHTMFVDDDRAIRHNSRAHLADAGCLEDGYGRFLQPDPSGYDDGLNWYSYVGGDPVNGTDPSGLSGDGTTSTAQTPEQIHACRPPNPVWDEAAQNCISADIVATGKREPLVTINASLSFLPTPQTPSTPGSRAGSMLSQTLNKNGQKPPSHDGGDPDYNRDLNRCRALADAGNGRAASICYANAETRKRLRDNGVPEDDLPSLVKSAAA